MRRDVVHAIGDSHILVVIQVLADFFEARVQVADVGNRVDDALAIKLEHDPQRGVRGGVLRAEVQRPQVSRLRVEVFVSGDSA